MFWAWEEVDQIGDAIFVDVAGLEDVGRWEVLLFRSVVDLLGGNDEIAALILVQKPAEDRWRVEIWPGELSVGRLKVRGIAKLNVDKALRRGASRLTST